MLSIYTLESAEEASRYYARGDYYTLNPPEQSAWFGEGAKRLGLAGMVDPAVFKKALEGYLPQGIVMRQTQRGEHHRPGYDLTFSAPKSVSILALVAGNQGILEAHRQAIEETLRHLEQKYAAVRNKDQGITTHEKTGNFVWARFEEYDSRAGDPQLHDHCVLLNATQKANGDWRALYFDEVYWDKIINGLEYRARLAQKLMALGYVLDFRAGGLFEIKGVPEGLIEALSKRRKDIESWLSEHQLKGGLASKIANFETRPSKKPEDLQTRQARWLEELKMLDVSLETLKKLEQDAKDRGPVHLPDPSFFAKDAMKAAIQHCSEKYPHFSIKYVIKMACRFSLFPITEADCLPVMEAQIAHQELVYVGKGLLRTKEAVEHQNQLMEALQSTAKVHPILIDWVADFILKLKIKSPALRSALKFLTTHQNAQLLIESPSKMALRDTLTQFNRLCEAQYFYPCFLSNRLSELDSLKQNLQTTRVMSLEGFLLGCEAKMAAQNPNPGRLEQWIARIKAKQAPEVWVVVSVMSLHQWLRLQGAARVLHARIILSQDSKYQQWLEPFKSAGLVSHYLEAPQTYVEGLELKAKVLRQIEHFTGLKAILEIKDPALQWQKAAALSIEQDRPLIGLSPRDCAALSEAVRTGLKERNRLGTAFRLPSLEPLALSQAQKAMVASYQPGDVLRFPKQKQGRYFEGHYERVQSVDLAQGLVLFESGKSWSPTASEIPLKRIEGFKWVRLEGCIGECMQWTRTVRHESDTSLDRIAYQKAFIKAFDPSTHTLTFALENGQLLSLKMDDLNHGHWHYGYATLLKQADLERPAASIVMLNPQALDAKTVEKLYEYFDQSQALRVPLKLITQDLEGFKQSLSQVDEPSKDGALKTKMPYQRHEALDQDQSMPTDSSFAGLQGEYLKVRKLNPEFFLKNLQKEPTSPLNPDTRLKMACQMLDWVSLYHAERDAVFSATTLLKEALQLAEGRLSSASLEQGLALALQKGWLITVGEPAHQRLVACRHTVLMEKLCIDEMRQGQGQLKPLFTLESQTIQAIQADPKLTQGQKDAIQLLLTTPDRACAVQGIAGAGKTTALKVIQKSCVAQGFEPLVLADTGNAKNQAQQVSGMVAMTLAQFLTQVETLLDSNPAEAHKDFGKHQLIILDEASMAATRDVFRLQRIVIALKVHLGFTGDFKQQGSLGAGLAFEDLLGYGIAKAVMKENVRLKSPKAFEAMQKAYAGDMSGTLAVLRDQIEEIPVKSEALARIVALYVGFIEQHRSPPLVITPLNKDRCTVNEGIREALKAKGYLGADCLQTTVLLPADRREIQKKHIRGFETDGVIRFNSAHPRLGIQAGSYWRVEAIDTEHHRLSLQPFIKDALDPDRCIYWSPKDLEKPSGIEVYRKESRQLAPDDWIIFKRNQPALGIFNGDKAQVLGVKGSQLEVRLPNQSIVRLELSDPASRHWDYGYALTIYQAQGRDLPYVIAYGEGLKPLERLGSHLKRGDWVVLPASLEPSASTPAVQPLSKVVRVLAIDEKQWILMDGQGNRYERSFDPKQSFAYLPLTADVPSHLWPKTTSQKALLVTISRGDWVHMIVPHLAAFKELLEACVHPKGSALGALDPHWPELNQSVQRLVMAIQWHYHSRDAVQTTVSTATLKTPVQDRDKKAPAFRKTSHPFVDKEAVLHRLNAHILDYATQWLGQPEKVSASTARWEGSFELTLQGPYQGHWVYWASNERGADLISLYENLYNMDWKTALRTLGKELGCESLVWTEPQKPSMPRKAQETSRSSDNHEKAKNIYAQAVPIQGTLAEKYLREVRGIPGDLPQDFRFIKATHHFETGAHPAALIAPVWDANHQLKAITRIFLNPDGSKYVAGYQDKKGKTQTANPRLSLGVMGQAGVRVQEGVDPRTLWLAEGVETALSVAAALPDQAVVATTSAQRLKSIAPAPGVETIVICADQDGVRAQSYQSVRKAAQHYLNQGLKVFIAMPQLEGSTKVDFNDVLKHRGVLEVQQILAQKVEIKSLGSLDQSLNLPQALEKIRQAKVPVPETIARAAPQKGLEQER